MPKTRNRVQTWIPAVFAVIAAALSALVLTESEARAYTDPGSGALLWQMLVAAGLGFAFYARRAVSWLSLKRKQNNKRAPDSVSGDPKDAARLD